MSIYGFYYSWAYPFYQWDHAFSEISPSLYLCKIHTYTETPYAFMKFERGLSTKSQALYTKNEWPNFDWYIIVMEENEWEKDDVKEFARLIE
jgi:hypothetical protein